MTDEIMEAAVKKKTKKKKRKSKGNTVLLVILFVVIFMLIAAGITFYFFSNSLMLKGTYTRRIDMTENAITAMNKYLGEATFGNEIDASDYIDSISVKTTLTLGPGSLYSEAISDEEYENAKAQVNSALKEALTDLILRRMEAASLNSDKDIETLLFDALGMSFDEYLSSYGPQLIPSIEELRNKYQAEGIYSADRNTITIDTVSDTVVRGKNSYLVSDKLLIIQTDNNEYVYIREEAE